MTAEVAEELFAQSGDAAENELGVDPDTGHVIVARDGRYGPYVTEILPEPEEVNGSATGEEGRRRRSSRAPRRCSSR